MDTLLINGIDDHFKRGATVCCVLIYCMYLGFYLCAGLSCSYRILLMSGRLHEGVVVVLVDCGGRSNSSCIFSSFPFVGRSRTVSAEHWFRIATTTNKVSKDRIGKDSVIVVLNVHELLRILPCE